MNITIRPFDEADLPEARRIISLAFGTFVGVPDPSTFMTDLDYPGALFPALNVASFAAEADGEFVGSNFATRWGTVGYFGPLSVRVDLWDQGVGQKLMEPIMDTFSEWGVTHRGLYTFPESPKHINLYQKYGFWPRFLTAVMSKRVTETPGQLDTWHAYSEKSQAQQEATLEDLRALCDGIYPGLDLSDEIRSTLSLGLGDVVLLNDGNGFAVCHCGETTSAGAEVCLMKFGAARMGDGASENFRRLTEACEAFAATRSLTFLTGGVNLSRVEAYRIMRERGFRTRIQGVAMHGGNEAGYCRPGVFVLDDWR